MTQFKVSQNKIGRFYWERSNFQNVNEMCQKWNIFEQKHFSFKFYFIKWTFGFNGLFGNFFLKIIFSLKSLNNLLKFLLCNLVQIPSAIELFWTSQHVYFLWKKEMFFAAKKQGLLTILSLFKSQKTIFFNFVFRRSYTRGDLVARQSLDRHLIWIDFCWNCSGNIFLLKKMIQLNGIAF